jgi:hypothetical protein
MCFGLWHYSLQKTHVAPNGFSKKQNTRSVNSTQRVGHDLDITNLIGRCRTPGPALMCHLFNPAGDQAQLLQLKSAQSALTPPSPAQHTHIVHGTKTSHPQHTHIVHDTKTPLHPTPTHPHPHPLPTW